MKKLISIVFVLMTFFLSNAQTDPTLAIGLEGLAFKKGSIDVEALRKVLIKKQNEIKREGLKRFAYKVFPEKRHYTTRLFLQEAIRILIDENNQNIIEKELLQLTTNYGLALGIAKIYITNTGTNTASSEAAKTSELSFKEFDNKIMSHCSKTPSCTLSDTEIKQLFLDVVATALSQNTALKEKGFYGRSFSVDYQDSPLYNRFKTKKASLDTLAKKYIEGFNKQITSILSTDEYIKKLLANDTFFSKRKDENLNQQIAQINSNQLNELLKGLNNEKEKQDFNNLSKLIKAKDNLKSIYNNITRLKGLKNNLEAYTDDVTNGNENDLLNTIPTIPATVTFTENGTPTIVTTTATQITNSPTLFTLTTSTSSTATSPMVSLTTLLPVSIISSVTTNSSNSISFSATATLAKEEIRKRINDKLSNKKKSLEDYLDAAYAFKTIVSETLKDLKKIKKVRLNDDDANLMHSITSTTNRFTEYSNVTSVTWGKFTSKTLRASITFKHRSFEKALTNLISSTSSSPKELFKEAEKQMSYLDSISAKYKLEANSLGLEKYTPSYSRNIDDWYKEEQNTLLEVIFNKDVPKYSKKLVDVVMNEVLSTINTPTFFSSKTSKTIDEESISSFVSLHQTAKTILNKKKIAGNDISYIENEIYPKLVKAQFMSGNQSSIVALKQKVSNMIPLMEIVLIESELDYSIYKKENASIYNALEFMVNLDKLNKAEVFSYIIQLLEDASDLIVPSTTASNSKKEIKEEVKFINIYRTVVEGISRYAVIDKENELIEIDVISFLEEFDRFYIRNNDASLSFYFRIGASNNHLFNVHKTASGDTIRSFSFMSEKIGIKWKIKDYTTTKRYSEKKLEGIAGNESKAKYNYTPIFKESYISLYGSGILYNLVDLSTNKELTSPVVGLGLGVSAFNALDISINIGLPIRKNTPIAIKNGFFGLSMDIPIGEYISSLGKK